MRRAIERAGSQAALAKRLDEIGQRQSPALRCKPQNVWAWLNRDLRVPGEWARLVSEAVDFAVLPHEIRRDLYPHVEDGIPPDRRIIVVLDELADVLRPSEHEALVDAIKTGRPDVALKAIEDLNIDVAARTALLRAAGEGRSR